MINSINFLFVFSFALAYLFLLFNLFDFLAFIISIFKKHSSKIKIVNVYKKYAIIIAAKNESLVIKDIILSFKNQTYDKKLFDIFVVADNCTDSTAFIARENGAIVFERFDESKKGANFAIQFAIKKIIQLSKSYDAFCYFDSDNIVDKNWLTNVNKGIVEGYDVLTTYRNSINFGDNWISASYAIQFIKESRFINNGRAIMKMTSFVNGTGFCFTKKILHLTNFWDFNSLSHDIEFSQFLSINNIKCGYINDAIFYDEQPVSFKDSYKQRLRWSKGFLQVFKIYGSKEIIRFLNFKQKNKKSIWANFFTIFPQIFFFLINFLFYLIIGIMIIFIDEKDKFKLWFEPKFFWILTPIFIIGGLYLMSLWYAIVIIFLERKQIACSLKKSIFYAFTYPFFMLTYIPISLIAIFKKNVTTNPIKRKIRN